MNIIYELAYLISPQLDEAEVQDLAKKIEKTLGESGTILGSLEPKKIKLAYPIKKQEEGFLVSIDFTAEPKFILLLSREMEKEINVLRFLCIKKSPEKPEPIKAEPLIKKTETKEEPENKKEEIIEAPKKEKVKKEKPAEKVKKEDDLKKIEKDLDEILGQ
ncbi:MAG: 30S ribosomal protein S6 [bacterium]